MLAVQIEQHYANCLLFTKRLFTFQLPSGRFGDAEDPTFMVVMVIEYLFTTVQVLAPQNLHYV